MTVEDITRRLLRVLEGVTADPQAPVDADRGPGRGGAPPGAVGVERHRGGRCRGPRCRSCSRPRRPARRRPPRWCFEDTELSYGELNARANRLARLLIGRGVGPESLVAVVMERSADLVVALLAVLKAGGAYLPVDPGYPADRISYMLTDAVPVLALTDQAQRGQGHGAGLPGLPLLVLDDPALAAEFGGLDGADVTDAERLARLSPDSIRRM